MEKLCSPSSRFFSFCLCNVFTCFLLACWFVLSSLLVLVFVLSFEFCVCIWSVTWTCLYLILSNRVQIPLYTVLQPEFVCVWVLPLCSLATNPDRAGPCISFTAKLWKLYHLVCYCFLDPHGGCPLIDWPEMMDSTAICHPPSFPSLNVSSSVPLSWHSTIVTGDTTNIICHLSPHCVKCKGRGLIFDS